MAAGRRHNAVTEGGLGTLTTVCLTFDFDAVALWVSSFKATSPTPVSRGEFGARVGLPRLLKLLAEKGIKATFFVPAHTAVSFPIETRRIAEEGHEVALHGYCHEAPVGLSRDQEADLLDRSIAKLRSVLGADYAFRGYRSPSWDLTENSVELLVERGLLYDSSMMADDFRPYRARIGDKVDEEAFSAGKPSPLIEIPVAWELDDFPYFTFLNRPLYSGLRNPDDVFQCWKSEFDYCHTCVPGGVFTLTMHPQIIGRGPRIKLLERLIEHMRHQNGVAFCTVAETAQLVSAQLCGKDS
jgi:peptidoglycan/xylan/chitin deacetylase (PgdA/CDA1 family)